MQYLYTLKQIANDLDKKGFYKQADRIDFYLSKIAQEAAPPALDPGPVPELDIVDPVSPTGSEELDEDRLEEKMARTTYLMFKELRDLYMRVLPDFDYLGKDNIKIIQAAYDNLMNLFRTVLRGRTADYDVDALSEYIASLRKSEIELNRSKKMKLTPAKVKLDKFLLYEELEILMRKLQRVYDNGDFPELNPVVRKARALRDAFANVIKQVSEEIANQDLIEVS